MKALLRSSVPRLEPQQTRERPHVIQFPRVLVRVLPCVLRLERRRIARRPVERQGTRDDSTRRALARPHDAQLARELVALLCEAVLVGECRFEVEFVVRAPREPIAQSRERARRVEVAVQQTVGLRLVARAVVHVGGELITLAELVADAAGQRVRQRDLRAQPCLLEECQWALVVVLAEDRVAPRTVVPEEAVAAVQR